MFDWWPWENVLFYRPWELCCVENTVVRRAIATSTVSAVFPPNLISLPHRVLELSPAAPLAIAPNVGPRLRWIALKLAPQLVGAGCRLSRWLPVQKLAFSDPAIGMSVVVT